MTNSSETWAWDKLYGPGSPLEREWGRARWVPGPEVLRRSAEVLPLCIMGLASHFWKQSSSSTLAHPWPLPFTSVPRLLGSGALAAVQLGPRALRVPKGPKTAAQPSGPVCRSDPHPAGLFPTRPRPRSHWVTPICRPTVSLEAGEPRSLIPALCPLQKTPKGLDPS